jgi:hypothetical protein
MCLIGFSDHSPQVTHVIEARFTDAQVSWRLTRLISFIPVSPKRRPARFLGLGDSPANPLTLTLP